MISLKVKFYYQEPNQSLKQYCSGLSVSSFHIGTRFILKFSSFKPRNHNMVSVSWTFSNLLLLRYLIFLKKVHFTKWNFKSICWISYFQKKRNNSITLGIYFYFRTTYHVWSRADKSKIGWYQMGKRIIIDLRQIILLSRGLEASLVKQMDHIS